MVPILISNPSFRLSVRESGFKADANSRESDITFHRFGTIRWVF